jgi:hypothetical protein
MSLWNPRKPLNQPPHFRLVAGRDEIKRDEVAAAAKSALQEAQFARAEKTTRLGGRAVVKV